MDRADSNVNRLRHEFCCGKGMMPSRNRILGGLATLALAAVGNAQTDIAIVEAYTSDAKGAPKAVRTGEPYYVGARFQVSGSPNNAYRFRIESDFFRGDSARLSFGQSAGSYYVFYGPVPSLTQASYSFKVILDPERRVSESNRNNNTAELQIHPIPPSAPIESYDPKSLAGRLGLDVEWRSNSGVPSQVVTWMPVPPTETFQQSGSVTVSSLADILTSEPFSQEIAQQTFRPTNLSPIRVESSISTVASSVRVNTNMLRLYSNRASSSETEWLRRETYVEWHRPEIRQWLNQVASPYARRSLSTAQLAERIYRSVLKRCRYEFRPGTAPSASQTARLRKGDCGGLSSLFVALCRAAGIPARTVNGFAAGNDNWHIWAEFHVNGAGWVPVDPAYAEGRLLAGSDLPIYFGVVPELNERVATGFGLDREAGGRSLPMLQSPAVFWTGSNVRLSQAKPFSSLSAN